MKELKKLVLVQLEQNELTKRETVRIRGGRSQCQCGCCSHLPGYSGTEANGYANCGSNLTGRCNSDQGTYYIGC